MLDLDGQVIKVKLEKITEEVEAIDEEGEDFPGQKKDYFRQEVIRAAVSLADKLICEAGNSPEEIDYFTVEVAKAFLFKVHQSIGTRLASKDIAERIQS